MNKKVIYPLIIALVIAGSMVMVALVVKNGKTPAQTSVTVNTTTSPTSVAEIQPSVPPTPKETTNGLVLPIADLSNRITKKPFGIYITPKNSPVQPERFNGYHTGADVEYQDITTDVPVQAIADGIIIYSRTASGYGGVEILETTINGKPQSILYGHIRPSSLTAVNTQVKRGQEIGLLGTAYSFETDGERRHLHFAVLSNDRIDIKGYVSSEGQLSGWIDPVTLFK